jgi:pimeloyl-ACP methyl ester carboxylesterase
MADAGYRVLLWDRPGCGASDIAFTASSESVMNSEALVGIVRELGLEDVVLLGGSAGSRISLMAAARMPENVSKIAIWWISGGPLGLAGLAWFYGGDQINAASKGGMEAVAALPSWADQISRNPRIRELLLAQDPDTFIETMQRWGIGFAYSETSPVPGMTAEDFERLTMPVLAVARAICFTPGAPASGCMSFCPIRSCASRRGAIRNGTMSPPSLSIQRTDGDASSVGH